MRTGLRRRAVGCGLAFALLAPASTASAQSFRIRGEALIGYEHFLASETFKGVFGSANAPVFGGGVDIGLYKNWFIRVDATRFNKTGERAFVINGIVENLGIPLTVTITPVTFVGGYRGPIGGRPKPPVRGARPAPRKPPTLFWYIGGGGGSWAYSEHTDDPTETVSFRKSGFLGLGGIEWQLQKYVGLGVEAQYASVPNALNGGIAQQFNEKDLGGASVMARVIVGR